MDGKQPPTCSSVRRKQPRNDQRRRRPTSGVFDNNSFKWTYPGACPKALMEFMQINPEHYGQLEQVMASAANINITDKHVVLTRVTQQNFKPWKEECLKKLKDFFQPYAVRTQSVNSVHLQPFMLEDSKTHVLRWKERNFTVVAVAGLAKDVDEKIHFIKQEIKRPQEAQNRRYQEKLSETLPIQPHHRQRLPDNVMQNIAATSNASLLWLSPNLIQISGTYDAVGIARQLLLDDIFRTKVKSCPCPPWIFERISNHRNHAMQCFPEIQISNENGEINILGHPSEVNLVYERISAEIAFYGEVRISVPKQYHKCIIGVNGQKIAELRNKHQVAILVPLADSSDTDILLHGKRHLTARAKAEIEHLVESTKKMDKNASFRMPVKPSHRHRLEKKVLQKVKKDTGVQTKWQPSGEILLTGPREKLRQAEDALRFAIDSSETMFLEVPLWMMSYLTHFEIEGKQSWPEVVVTRVENGFSLTGHHTEVRPFLNHLREKVDLLQETKCCETLLVNSKFHGSIIGKRGQKIKSLQEKYKVEILVPKEGDCCDDVMIHGDKEMVLRAKKEILDLVSCLEKSAKKTVPVKPGLEKYLSDSISEIQKQFSEIKIERAQKRITLTGRIEKVDEAAGVLQKKLNQLESRIKRVTVPMTDCSLLGIVGWKHKNLKKLRNKFQNINICFIRDPPAIVIDGEKEKVENAHVCIVEMIPESADFCIAEVSIPDHFMGKFIGIHGKNLNDLFRQYPRITDIDTPGKHTRDGTVKICGSEMDVGQLCSSLYDRYGALVVKRHVKLPRSGFGSLSPEKKNDMYGSHSSLSSTASSVFKEAYDSDDSADFYSGKEFISSPKAVFYSCKLEHGLSKFLHSSAKSMENLQARLGENVSLRVTDDAISVAGQVPNAQGQTWMQKQENALHDFMNEFSVFQLSFHPLSSVERIDYSDEDLMVCWEADGQTVFVIGVRDKVQEKLMEFEEIQRRTKKVSYSWPCQVKHYFMFLRESLSQRRVLEDSLAQLGQIELNDGDITVTGDVSELTDEHEWKSDCKSHLEHHFSLFKFDEIVVPFLLAGEMRFYCKSQQQFTTAWSENSSLLVYGVKSEVEREADFLRKKLEELKSRKKSVSLTWKCENMHILDFVRESSKQIEELVKFLGKTGSPTLSNDEVSVCSQIFQTQSTPEWEIECRNKLNEFFKRFGESTVSVSESQIKRAEAEVEVLSSVITKWIPAQNHLQICGVKADVNLKTDLIKKKLEKSEVLDTSEMQQAFAESEVDDSMLVQEFEEFSLTLKLTERTSKYILASKTERELRDVRIEGNKDGVKIYGKRDDIFRTKKFIDSLVLDELEVKKYGAFEFLTDSTISLQMEHIGIKHNCSYAVEQVIDTNWGDKNFVCLPIESDMEMIFGKLSVTVEEGDLTSDNADMIVNTSDKSFSFRGPLSKAVFAKAGEGLKEVFHSSTRTDRDMGVTSGGGLRCKSILHVAIPAQSESMEALVVKILKQADKIAMTSITLPTIGAGGGGWSSHDVALAMRKGIANFATQSHNPVHLKKVKIMLFPHISSHDKKPFYDQLVKNVRNQEMKNESVTKTESQPSFVYRVISFFSRQSQPSKRGGASPETRPEVNDVNANSTSERTVEVKKTEHGEFAKIIISSNSERSVKEAKKEMEKFVNRNLKEFVFDTTAVSRLKWRQINKLRKIAEEQKVRIVVNRENQNHSIVIQGADEYASCAKDEVQKILSGISTDLPDTWRKMQDGQKVLRVVLNSRTQEYQDVEQRFTQANKSFGHYTIVKIERIQNPTLYRQYQSKKAEIEARSSSCGEIERELFHGTDSDTIDKICNDVFNRSYAGKNATAYGKGVYFSIASSYSNSYASRNNDGTQQMFLARVLTGDYCQGNSSMLDPPQNPATGEVYDSVVDRAFSPTIFVVFRDWSVYPLYVITYRS